MVSNTPLIIRDQPQETAHEIHEEDQGEQGAQTARVERGSTLPPRRQGSGSRAPREQQAQENVEAQEIGPLRVTKPARDLGYARRVISCKEKSAVVRKASEEDPHKY